MGPNPGLGTRWIKFWAAHVLQQTRERPRQRAVRPTQPQAVRFGVACSGRRPAGCRFRTLPSRGPLRERNGWKERMGVVTARGRRQFLVRSEAPGFRSRMPGSQSTCSLSVPRIATGSGGRRRSGTWLLTIQSIDHAAEGFARVNDAPASGIPAQFGFR